MAGRPEGRNGMQIEKETATEKILKYENLT